MERLDKIVSVAYGTTRNMSKKLISKGLVSVNGQVITNPATKVEENSLFLIDGQESYYNKFVYIMMNKPKGVVSASEGEKQLTVVDILPNDMKRKNLFPAGRLDKDTTGFVLITDDGEFSHKILSPKNHIDKTYIATLDKAFDDEVVSQFKNGVKLKTDTCLEADIEPMNDEKTIAKVIIHQGLYHQVKRMFGKFGITVVELQRIKMGNLFLDEKLPLGSARYITKDELMMIYAK